MSIPRGLTPEEAAAWAKLAASVTPFEGRNIPLATPKGTKPSKASVKVPPKQSIPRPASQTEVRVRAAKPSPYGGLDSHWDRRLKAGDIAPDFTLDLHGHNLDSAYTRLMDGMAQARAMGARTVLLIAGRSRPVDPADRGQRRGAIRAKLFDWLAASEHGDAIAAIRKAHQRHGGAGALYLVLRRGA